MRQPLIKKNVPARKITLWVNGEKMNAEEGATLETLLGNLSITSGTKGVAVACNGEVISKDQWKKIRVAPDSRIEIVHAVQGG